MKVLHLTYHYGCANDLNYIFKKLGHQITFADTTCWPYLINQDIAEQIWSSHKELFQSFDLIITSDTVALSLPLLLHYNELKPKLMIWICNRFNVFMDNVPILTNLLKKYESEITIIPYIEFERIWCRKCGVSITHETINPLGRHDEQYMCNETIMHKIFSPLDRSRQTKSDQESIFVPDYNNNKRLIPFLEQNAISFVHGRYMDIHEVIPYKAILSLPDAFGKILYHEAIQQEIVLLIPSPKFITELVKGDDYSFTSKVYEQTDNFYIHCEYFKYKNCYLYFDSFEDLIYKIRNIDLFYNTIKETLRIQKNIIHDRILKQWELAIHNTIRPKICIAIYNGLECHHEMIGHALEYCKEKQFKPIVYYNEKSLYSWMNYYKELFGEFIHYPYTQYSNDILFKDHINATLLLTDDDYNFPESIIQPNKVICIDHFHIIRRIRNLKRIDIRPFERTHNDKWVLPVYGNIMHEHKRSLLQNQTKLRIACIGEGAIFDIEYIKTQLTNFNEIEFYLFYREDIPYLRSLANEYPNIHLSIALSCNQLIDILKQCHYSLFVPYPILSHMYHYEKISGSIPLAFATGCRIITLKSLADQFKLDSCFIIDHPSGPVQLPFVTDPDLNGVYQELDELRRRRNKWYDALLPI
jgi:hypothetical protein